VGGGSPTRRIRKQQSGRIKRRGVGGDLKKREGDHAPQGVQKKRKERKRNKFLVEEVKKAGGPYTSSVKLDRGANRLKKEKEKCTLSRGLRGGE